MSKPGSPVQVKPVSGLDEDFVSRVRNIIIGDHVVGGEVTHHVDAVDCEDFYLGLNPNDLGMKPDDDCLGVVHGETAAGVSHAFAARAVNSHVDDLDKLVRSGVDRDRFEERLELAPLSGRGLLVLTVVDKHLADWFYEHVRIASEMRRSASDLWKSGVIDRDVKGIYRCTSEMLRKYLRDVKSAMEKLEGVVLLFSEDEFKDCEETVTKGTDAQQHNHVEERST